jgi:hypothetical protein
MAVTSAPAVSRPETLNGHGPHANGKEREERPVLTGAEITCKALEAEGVDVVFGYPGGAVIPLYDALPGAGFHHVLVRFEQWAALAADGYARATGRVGVCMATSGPGPPTSSPVSPTPSSTPCRSSPSPVRSCNR